MRSCGLFLLVSLAAAFIGTAQAGCFAYNGPQLKEWGGFRLTSDPTEGTVTIANTASAREWKASPPRITFFSKFYITPSGSRVVHVRSNHDVQELSDTALEIIEANGNHHSVAASELIPAFVKKDGIRMSTDPVHKWFDRIISVTDSLINLVTADGREHSIEVETGRVV